MPTYTTVRKEIHLQEIARKYIEFFENEKGRIYSGQTLLAAIISHLPIAVCDLLDQFQIIGAQWFPMYGFHFRYYTKAFLKR